MKRVSLIAATIVLLLAAAGCFNRSKQEGKAVAYQRWYQTRATMLYGVGLEHLKVGQLDRAKNKAQEALALAPTHFDARMLLGKVYIEKGQYLQAVAELAKAVQQQPKSDQAVFLLAVALEKAERLEEALTNYRRAYALNTKNISAVQAAAEVLVAMGRAQEAYEFIQGYLGEFGEAPAMFETAGRLALMQKRYDKAATFFQKAYDLDYTNVQYLGALAKAQFLAGQHERAAESLKDLTEQKGYTAPVWVYTMLGDAYLALGKPLKARDAYYVATERRPQDPGVWVNLGKAAMELGDMARAMLSARQALELEPGRLDATMVLSYAMIRSGQAQNAIALLTRAVGRHPSSGTLQCLLGRAYAETGDGAQAKRCYALAARLEPDCRLARELLAGPAPKGGAS